MKKTSDNHQRSPRLSYKGADGSWLRVRRSGGRWVLVLAVGQWQQTMQESDREEGNLMALFFWAIVGGLIGTGLMDIAGNFAERLKITTGGS